MFKLQERNDVDIYEDIKDIAIFKEFIGTNNMIKYIKESATFLQQRGFDNPEIGIILGTGLGLILDKVNVEVEMSYNHIPNFPTATVEFHKGKLIYGTLGEEKSDCNARADFICMKAIRLNDITFPVRVMHELGISKLLVSNASGAINTNFKKGEIMLIDDHINLQGGSPLAFKGVEKMGERFVDMSAPYDIEMNTKFRNKSQLQTI